MTVSLALSVLSKDVRMAFSFEASMLYSKWRVKRIVSYKMVVSVERRHEYVK